MPRSRRSPEDQVMEYFESAQLDAANVTLKMAKRALERRVASSVPEWVEPKKVPAKKTVGKKVGARKKVMAPVTTPAAASPIVDDDVPF